LFRRADSQFGDVGSDVAYLKEKLTAPELRVVLVFATPEQDLSGLARALTAAFNVPVVGCTGAGVIGSSGVLTQGVSAAAFYGAAVTVESYVIEPLSDYLPRSIEIGHQVRASLSQLPEEYDTIMLLLNDGLSRMEEQLVAALHAVLPYVSLVGGSAADLLNFTDAKVLANGTFASNRAVLVSISGPFRKAVFQSQHFSASAIRLVVTDAVPDQRLVLEFDGKPAAKRYADAIGTTVDQLGPSIYARHPLLERWGQQDFVRSIQGSTPDWGLKLYSAIQKGEVVRLGLANDPLQTLRLDLASVKDWLGVAEWDGCIGFDGVLRRIGFQEQGILDDVVAEYEKAKMVGCGTFGEQVNARYVNHTLTGVAFVGR
jgi:hypothetical protein